MKYIIAVLVVFLTISVVVASFGSSQKTYQPTERIPADTAVSFPVDI